jgi:hypothetical protein
MNAAPRRGTPTHLPQQFGPGLLDFGLAAAVTSKPLGTHLVLEISQAGDVTIHYWLDGQPLVIRQLHGV